MAPVHSLSRRIELLHADYRDGVNAAKNWRATRRTQAALAAELATFSTPSERADVDAMLDAHPDSNERRVWRTIEFARAA